MKKLKAFIIHLLGGYTDSEMKGACQVSADMTRSYDEDLIEKFITAPVKSHTESNTEEFNGKKVEFRKWKPLKPE